MSQLFLAHVQSIGKALKLIVRQKENDPRGKSDTVIRAEDRKECLKQKGKGNEKCKEIWENRMEKTKDLFKKMTDTKGTFQAKMGTIKDRNGTDLTEAEILRRGGKNTQNYTKRLS